MPNSITEALRQLVALPSNIEGAAKTLNTAASNIATTGQAATNLPAQLQAAVGGVAKKAEQYAYATIVLQAIAALSAAGMLYVQWQLLKKSKRQPVRSNPRRKRGYR